jgi:hypothetical protein
MRLATGKALARLFESRATLSVHVAPSPWELLRTDNTPKFANVPALDQEPEPVLQ